MKTTSFSQHLGTYFDEYLPNVRNYSPMSLPAACKMEHDAIGHYARPDILELKVNEK